jgi:glycosyltransferase involved in cell wall biosynthesis
VDTNGVRFPLKAASAFVPDSPQSMAPERTWLFVVPWDPRRPGGVDQVVLNLFREMSRGRHTPRMLISSWEHPIPVESIEDGRPTARLRLRSPVGAKRQGLHTLTWLLSLPAELLRLHKYLRTHRVAVANAHFPGLSAIQFVLVKRILQPNLRLILSFHGLDIVAASKTKGLERWLWKYLLRSADALVACSEDLAEQVRAFEPRAKGRIVAIHNGLDIDAFMSERDPEFMPDPSLDGRQIILNVAAYEPKKGLDILIRAFSMIVEPGESKLCLVLVGVDRGIRGELEALAANLGARERILFFADVPHSRLHPFYRAARVFCLPSRSEPFGLVLLEAGAFALPVVASRVGGIPEIISHEQTGLLVTPDDPALLAETLSRLLRDPSDRARLGEALMERVKTEFTWTTAYARYMTLVDGPTEAKSPRSVPTRKP